MLVTDINEIRKDSEYVSTIVDSTPGTAALLVRAAGESFAEILDDVPDKASAAIALYTAGKMMAKVAASINKEVGPDKTTGVIASYAMSLAYAAHKLLNK